MTHQTFDDLEIGPAFEVKFFDGADAGVFDGYAATFNGVDLVGDTIQPGAFADTLAMHASAGTKPALLWHHRGGEPVGQLVAMHEDPHGLRVKGKLNLDTPAGRTAHAHVKAGDVSGLSIGYVIPPGGQERLSGGRRLLKRLDLHEVTITPMPADPRARVTGVKSLTSINELERGLRGEIPLSLPRGAAAKLAAGGWPALVGGQEPPQPDPALAVLAKRLDAAVLDLKSLKGR